MSGDNVFWRKRELCKQAFSRVKRSEAAADDGDDAAVLLVLMLLMHAGQSKLTGVLVVDNLQVRTAFMQLITGSKGGLTRPVVRTSARRLVINIPQPLGIKSRG